MKYIFLLLTLSILFFTCTQQTTEEKITQALKKFVTSEVSKDGSLESLTLDSVRYSEQPMSRYFEYWKGKILTNKHINEEQLPSVSQDFDTLIAKSDTAVKIYEVDYHSIIRTNKENTDSHNKLFMNEKDLSIVENDNVVKLIDKAFQAK